MSIDQLLPDKATNRERMLAYALAQEQDMRTVYNSIYRHDSNPKLTFKEFLPHYVEHGHAEKFHRLNYYRYFKEETK